MWLPPEPGDIVWCRFPQRPRDVPGPKPRPALVMAVAEQDDGYTITVAYGTSQKIDRLYSGEFAIRRNESLNAFTQSGLSFDTKFNLRETVDVPWNENFFAVPLHPRFGQTPLLGSVHPCLMKAIASALCAPSCANVMIW